MALDCKTPADVLKVIKDDDIPFVELGEDLEAETVGFEGVFGAASFHPRDLVALRVVQHAACTPSHAI